MDGLRGTRDSNEVDGSVACPAVPNADCDSCGNSISTAHAHSPVQFGSSDA